jgi:hypothetical protein
MNPVRKKITSHETGRKSIQSASADMLQLYEAAKGRILAKIAQNSQKSRDPLSGKYLVALNEAIAKEYAELEAQLRGWGKAQIPYIAQSYYFMALQDLDTKGAGTMGKFSADRVKVMTDDYFRHVAGATNRMADTAIRHLRNVSAEIFRQSALTGQNRQEVSKQLLSKALDFPGFQFVDKAGRVWNNDSYFKMLGRTVLLNASRETYINACAEKESDIVRVTISGKCCPACAKYENRLLSVSGKSPDYPSLDSAIAEGLFHPNCTHSVKAISDYQKENQYDENGRPTNGLNSEGKAQTAKKEDWQEYRNEQVKKIPDKPKESPEILNKRTAIQQSVTAAGFSGPIAKEALNIPGKIIKEIPAPTFKKARSAKYHPLKKQLDLGKDATTWHGTAPVFHHEYGHHVHETGGIISQSGTAQTFRDACDSDNSSMTSKLEKAFGTDWKTKLSYSNIKSNFSDIASAHLKNVGIDINYRQADVEIKQRALFFLDTLGGLTRGTLGQGHSRPYYKKQGKMEVFANCYAAKIKGWTEFEEYFPAVFKEIKKHTEL